jgi:hypothetical protein
MTLMIVALACGVRRAQGPNGAHEFFRQNGLRFCESGGVRFPSATRPIWERRGGNGRNVTFPARQYAVNGERRSFALLRPIADASAQEKIRELILDAYQEYEDRAAVADWLSQAKYKPRPSAGLVLLFVTGDPALASVVDFFVSSPSHTT